MAAIHNAATIMITRTRPSRDYEPEMAPIESVTRYVTVCQGDGKAPYSVPISVARLKFLDGKEKTDASRRENESSTSSGSCGPVAVL
jgi:hypothetical protein